MLHPHMPQIPLGRSATYDDLVALPEHLVAEIVDGELWASPRPAPRHATADQRLEAILVPEFERGGGGRGGWRLLGEPELHLGSHVVVPDIAGWRIERMPCLPDTAYFTVAPDWICEVLSPSTARLDRDKKLRIYAEAGVAFAWLVDPLARSLEVLKRADTASGSASWTPLATHVGGHAVQAEPFEVVDIRLGWLWDEE